MKKLSHLLLMLSLTMGGAVSLRLGAHTAAYVEWDDPFGFLLPSPWASAAHRPAPVKETIVKAAENSRKLVEKAHEEAKKLPEKIEKAWESGVAELHDLVTVMRKQLLTAEEELRNIGNSMRHQAARKIGQAVAPIVTPRLDLQESGNLITISLTLPEDINEENISARLVRDQRGSTITKQLKLTALTPEAQKQAAAATPNSGEPATTVFSHRVVRQESSVNGRRQTVSYEDGRIEATVDLPLTTDDDANPTMKLERGQLTIALPLLQDDKRPQERVIKFQPTREVERPQASSSREKPAKDK